MEEDGISTSRELGPLMGEFVKGGRQESHIVMLSLSHGATT